MTQQILWNNLYVVVVHDDFWRADRRGFAEKQSRHSCKQFIKFLYMTGVWDLASFAKSDGILVPVTNKRRFDGVGKKLVGNKTPKH